VPSQKTVHLASRLGPASKMPLGVPSGLHPCRELHADDLLTFVKRFLRGKGGEGIHTRGESCSPSHFTILPSEIMRLPWFFMGGGVMGI